MFYFKKFDFNLYKNLSNRRFLGIDKETAFLEISKNRKIEIENDKTAFQYRQKISGFETKNQMEHYLVEESKELYSTNLNL